MTPETAAARQAPPPSRPQLALMIWLCVFPTLTVLNVTLSDWLAPMSTVVRTFVLSTSRRAHLMSRTAGGTH
jgi:hypothetical protein